MEILTKEQLASFLENGFLVVPSFFDPEDCRRASASVEEVFAGRYETGVAPDGMNFGQGANAETHNRQMDNSWKTNYTLASLALSRRVGQALTDVIGGPGARTGQDILIWKEPGAQSVYYHQDSSYGGGSIPPDVYSCAISLTSTSADVGIIEYVRGSHRWELAPPRFGGDFDAVDDYFYGPADYRRPVYEAAASQGIELTDDHFVQINAPTGHVVLHHARVWHGSGPNVTESEARKVLVSQARTSDVRYADAPPKDPISQMFRKYKHHGSNVPDEDYHPIIWREDGYRSPWLDEYLSHAPRLSDM